MPQLIILKHGDSFERLKEFAEDSVLALVSDPPYGLEFMGKDWDCLDLRGSTTRPDSTESSIDRSTRGMNHGMLAGLPAFDLTPDSQTAMQDWHRGWLVEVFRVLKPGGVIKAFSGTRTYHRLAAAMQQVGFLDIHLESWCYGSGFPKGLDVARAIDKELGVEREVVGQKTRTGKCPQPMWWDEGSAVGQLWDVTAPTSPQAKKWDGFNTALKPSWEPFIVGCKPT